MNLKIQVDSMNGTQSPSSFTGYISYFWKTLLRYLPYSTPELNPRIPPVKARVFAFYLPQFHPIPENDSWWGDGFTEWTNVKRAMPIFRNHEQPKIPADLGYYDLRDEKTRVRQAELAREAGMEGFLYWHYWFGNGKRLLERPFQEVLDSGSPDYPFCLAWANESWTGKWHGLEDHILVQQEYPGVNDYRAHFFAMQKAFSDPRYIKVGGRALFLVYKPWNIPDPKLFTDTWREMAHQLGMDDFYFIGVSDSPLPPEFGFDGTICGAPSLPEKTVFPTFAELFIHRFFNFNVRLRLRVMNRIGPEIYPYSSFVRHTFNTSLEKNEFPVVIPNWDNTPRVGRNGIVLQGATPALFSKLLRKSISVNAVKPEEERLIFIKSWNEWAEGNYIEPDQRWGTGYLDALKEVLTQIR